jgi:hypothetical protein
MYRTVKKKHPTVVCTNHTVHNIVGIIGAQLSQVLCTNHTVHNIVGIIGAQLSQVICT